MNWTGSILFFGVEDLEAAADFYGGTLGLELDRDQGLCRIYAVPGGGMIGFCSHQPVSHKGKSPIITLLTDDVDGWYRRLQEKGLKIEHEPRVNPKFNIYHFFLEDPHGYTVEIQKFL